MSNPGEQQHVELGVAAEESVAVCRVAYLGPPSSYTHQAAVDNFDQTHFELQAQPSIAEVFTVVQDGSVSYGVVPFENSSNGAVVQTLDLFGERSGQYSDIQVVGETFVAVHHCLLGYSDTNAEDGDPESGEATPTRLIPSPARSKVKPRRRVQHIRKVYSHPQAFGQCEAFLSVHLRSAERQEVSSTSRAAQIVAEDPTKATAAIASRMAAQVHNLEVLAAGIEDRPDNETRFLILRRGDNLPPCELGVSKAPLFLQHLHGQNDGDDAGGAAQTWKSLVGFTINHGETGALSKVLNLFRDYGLNLTSINSRPTRGRPWHYVFFVEFSGRKEGQGKVDEALTALKQVTTDSRWHGSWRKRGGV